MTSSTAPSNRAALLREIDKISFAVNEFTLFLDTHPDCQEALLAFNSAAKTRKELMKQYADAYGPLTVDCISTGGSADHWSWQDGPAPWEGGII